MCPDCKDTGTIETGNNDLPCHCPKGDEALFNVTGVPREMWPVTGKWLKEHPEF